MTLLPKALLNQLLRNGRRQAPVKGTDDEIDFRPVVKLFTPDAGATWLFTELDEDGDTLFGLCDLGMGCPELGYVSLAEIKSVRGKLGLPVERDQFWEATAPLSAYADAARVAGHIVDDLPTAPKGQGGDQ
jgi:Protein of unknown function (DUF2958)